MQLQVQAPVPVLVHFLATKMAQRKHRLVLVLASAPEQGGPEIWPLCAHSANCDFCKHMLAARCYVNLGTLQVGSKVEVEGILLGNEATAPAASQEFPQ